MAWQMVNGKWQMEMPTSVTRRQLLPFASHICHSPFSLCHRRSRAFSFAEVMFAVVILGIGFIMVAAIFPVAIHQSQSTGEESTAASIAREAANVIAQCPRTVPNAIYDPANNAAAAIPTGVPKTLLVFPPTVKNYVLGTTPGLPPPPAIVVPFSGPRWNAVRNGLILPSDPRFAFVPLYRRENGASIAQLIVIAVQTRNQSEYAAAVDADIDNSQTKDPSVTTSAGLVGSPAAAANTLIVPDSITITGSNIYPREGYSVNLRASLPGLAPAGRTYRLGRGYDISTFEIDPGDNMQNQASTSTGLWGTQDPAATSPVTFDNAVSGLQSFSTRPLTPRTTLQPTPAWATFDMSPESVAGRISLYESPDPVTQASPMPHQPINDGVAATGAFVVVADDYPFDPQIPSTTAARNYPLPNNIPYGPGPRGEFTVGSMNGRIFRLGSPVAGQPGVYDLDPGYGMRAVPNNWDFSPDQLPNPKMKTLATRYGYLQARVYIIGRAYNDPKRVLGNAGVGSFRSGNAQDIAAYTTFISVQ